MMPQITVNAIACVLSGVAKAICKFGIAAHNYCPWVSYINQAGRVCSHLIARAKFSGYHFKFGSSKTVVTNLETGKQYSVSLAGVQYCTCESFKYSPLPKVACKHIKSVVKDMIRIAWVNHEAKGIV